MNIKRRLKKELAAIDTPSIDKILSHTSQAYLKPHVCKRKKRLLPALAAILCIAIISGTALAAPAIVRFFNADILKTVERTDTVPDGYIGIYTVEQLNQIRNSPSSNYILMNDIDLDGQLWEPIHGYDGIFNGNGHIIKNLSIKGDQSSESLYFGLFGSTTGHFINLGIEDCSIDISFSASPTPYDELICVGSVAASATFIGGCYVQNVSINVSLANCDIEMDGGSNQTLFVGGLCGNVTYIDSCYSVGTITVTDSVRFDVNAGLCAGSAFSCITSYSKGDIAVIGNSHGVVNTHKMAVPSAGTYMPVLLNENAMVKLINTVDEHYKDNGFTSKRILSLYIPYTPDTSTPDGITNMAKKYFIANDSFGYVENNSQDNGKWYFCSTQLQNDEKQIILDVISQAFDGYAKFLDFCYENGIKCGMLNCYAFESNDNIDADALDGFDFDEIWLKKNENIILRIFDN